MSHLPPNLQSVIILCIRVHPLARLSLPVKHPFQIDRNNWVRCSGSEHPSLCSPWVDTITARWVSARPCPPNCCFPPRSPRPGPELKCTDPTCRKIRRNVQKKFFFEARSRHGSLARCVAAQTANRRRIAGAACVRPESTGFVAPECIIRNGPQSFHFTARSVAFQSVIRPECGSLRFRLGFEVRYFVRSLIATAFEQPHVYMHHNISRIRMIIKNFV